ncbi:MAG: sugar ABC transporter permease [Chloroflexi bacterium]|nr:sugar ABC transporter permease [Chloroflexota bacterium]
MIEETSPHVGTVPPKQLNTMTNKKIGEALAGYLFLTPALLIFLVFLVIPVIVALYLSFTDWNGITPLRNKDAYTTVGSDNYQALLTEPGRRQTKFFIAVKNTVYYVLGVVPTQTLIALILAVIVNQRWLKARGTFRTIAYLPSITSSVVISIVFLWLFSSGGLVNGFIGTVYPDYKAINWTDESTGVFHWVLKQFGVTRADLGPWASEKHYGVRTWDWISGPSVTMLMIMILNTWTTIGTMMVIFLAALQNIPSFVYEAAQIDGANAWQTFRKVTIPLLRPTTFFAVTLGLIGCFQVFDQVYIIGGGDATLTVAVLVHRNAFGTGSNMGLATATAMILFAIIFVFTVIQRRFFGGERANW